MRTIQYKSEITLEVKQEDLFEGRYVPYTLVSSKIKEFTEKNNLYKEKLSSKFRNSFIAGKYKTKEIATLRFIDVKDTMANDYASLILSFKLV